MRQKMKVPMKSVRTEVEVSALSRGCWQLASNHSSRTVNDEAAFQSIDDFVDAGITTLVCSDTYEGVESLIGRYISQRMQLRGADIRNAIQIHTTYCPGFVDNSPLSEWTPDDCSKAIDHALQRLRLEQIDVVYMHWADYSLPGYVEMALALQELRRFGKIRALGVTNFDVEHLSDIVSAGVDIALNMVQFSLLDRRPEHGMVDYCRDNDISLVTYGSIGGGYLSKAWLDVPDPGDKAFSNVSMEKYYGTISDFGRWSLFQELLQVLADIADAHGVSIVNVAMRYVMEKPQVASVIVGAVDSARLTGTLKCLPFDWTHSDLAAIDSVLERSTGPQGDCYSIERTSGRIVRESDRFEDDNR